MNDIDREIDWIIDRLKNWIIDRLIDWIINRLVDWIIDRLIGWVLLNALHEKTLYQFPCRYNWINQQNQLISFKVLFHTIHLHYFWNVKILFKENLLKTRHCKAQVRRFRSTYQLIDQPINSPWWRRFSWRFCKELLSASVSWQSD